LYNLISKIDSNPVGAQ